MPPGTCGLMAFCGVLATSVVFQPAQARPARPIAPHEAVAKMPPDMPMPVPRPHFAGPDAAGTTPPVAGSTGDGATGKPAPPAAGATGAAVQTTPAPGGPRIAGSGATTAVTPRQPPDDPSCVGRLLARKVAVERAVLGPQPDSRCTVVEPVRLSALTLEDGSTISFPDKPTIACTTADAFSRYVHDLMAPLVKGSFGTTLTAVWTGPGLECRARDSIFGAKLSAHGQGLAVDIAQVRFADGRTVEVGTPKTESETAFETAARAGACGYFHTVLGPGSDSYHRTHWHFDLLVRGKDGDGKYCK